MILENASDDVIEQLFRDCDTTNQRVNENAKYLKQWFEQQPHLPQCFESNDVLFFKIILMRCKCSMERAKQCLDLHFTIKSALPQFFTGLDPMGPELQKLMNDMSYLPLPKTSKQGYRVHIVQPTTKDASNYTMELVAKLILMTEDVKNRIHEDISVGDVHIHDYTHLSLGHIQIVNVSQIKNILTCLTKGYNARIKGIHLVNCPSYVDLLVVMLKAALSSKLKTRLYCHSTLEELHQFVDKQVLPREYGGEAGNYDVLRGNWRKEFESHGDWFLRQEVLCKVDESKRPGKPFDTNALLGIEGTFRKLEVD